jgi:hypothetical protein
MRRRIESGGARGPVNRGRANRKIVSQRREPCRARALRQENGDEHPRREDAAPWLPRTPSAVRGRTSSARHRAWCTMGPDARTARAAVLARTDGLSPLGGEDHDQR